MNGSVLREWGAIAAIGGGAGVATYNSVEFLAFSGAPLSELAMRPGWFAFQVAGLVVGAAVVLGLVAVYLAHADRLGRVGLVGFAMSIAGVLQYYGISWASAFLLTSVARSAPNVLDQPDAQVMAGILSTLLVSAIGLIVFSIAGLRCGADPRWAWWLLLAGTLASFPSEFAGITLPIQALAFGVAFAAIGAGMRPRRMQRAPLTASAA